MQLTRELGFDALSRMLAAPQCVITFRHYAKTLTQDEADEIVSLGRRAQSRHFRQYYDNNLSADPEVRAFVNQHSRGVSRP